MKAILRILFFLLFIVIAVVAVGLFLPDEHKIVVNKEIDVPRPIVFDLVNNFSNWKEWSPWILKDKQMVVKVNKPASGKGASMEWESMLFGNCKTTIIHSVSPESIAVNFDFGTPGKTTSLWYLDSTEDGTLVNWTMNLTKLNIWERYLVLFIKKDMKSLVESGTQSLDSLAMTYSRSRIGEIRVSQFESQPTIIMIDSVNKNRVPRRMEEMFDYVNRFFERRELTPTGNKFALFYGNINDTLVKFACGLPLAERTWVWTTLAFYQMPSTKVVAVSHFGYPTDKAHRAILKYIQANNLKRNGVPFEEYLYDPRTNNDTVNWETKVYYPVE